ncbi:MAG: class I SAM-dependent methyltransferase [Leptolyngbya sp. SIOISBB]|nr:class I SAM-dependent methyltransferase [Leptolyngbya sp. SIOISBB]
MSKKGSVVEFDQNWQTRKEAQYNHWIKGQPQNQIQLAFHNHYKVFSEFLKKDGILSGKCLEVGCGRGSISSHFAEHGYSCTLLDSSQSVLETAKHIFTNNGHEAVFVHGDANELAIADETFDIVVSIGLLEHFEDINKPIREQVRILKPGGRFFGYIVPERTDNIQQNFHWLNRILSELSKLANSEEKIRAKQPIYRSDFGSPRYLEAIKDLPVNNVETFGMYPLPMISHSPDFPFSLMPPPLELALTKIFDLSLYVRYSLLKQNPWICQEEIGQAFLLTFRKNNTYLDSYGT